MDAPYRDFGFYRVSLRFRAPLPVLYLNEIFDVTGLVKS